MIEINGIKYEQREIKSKKQSSAQLIIASLYMFLNVDFGSVGGKKPRPVVNLEQEFERIQNKTSKLSRSDRDWVENQFNYKYKAIQNL